MDWTRPRVHEAGGRALSSPFVLSCHFGGFSEKAARCHFHYTWLFEPLRVSANEAVLDWTRPRVHEAGGRALSSPFVLSCHFGGFSEKAARCHFHYTWLFEPLRVSANEAVLDWTRPRVHEAGGRALSSPFVLSCHFGGFSEKAARCHFHYTWLFEPLRVSANEDVLDWTRPRVHEATGRAFSSSLV